MNRFIVMLSFVAGLFVITPTYAWVYSGNVSVVEITEWEGEASVYFKLSNGTMCYVAAADKNMYSLILNMYVAGKRANIHCYDGVDTNAGVPGHRLHRVVSFIQ